MFELLQAYETATHEKNKVFRFVYTKYVRHKLKTAFFKKFRNSIYNIKLDKNLIEEFRQFYMCTHHNIRTPKVVYVNSIPFVDMFSVFSTIHIKYDIYHMKYKFLDDSCDIKIENRYAVDVELSVHPENEIFYEGFYAEILIIAIYNYCVAYIYGTKSKLYISDSTYINKIRAIYL